MVYSVCNHTRDYHPYDYRPNWAPLSPITIINQPHNYQGSMSYVDFPRSFVVRVNKSSIPSAKPTKRWHSVPEVSKWQILTDEDGRVVSSGFSVPLSIKHLSAIEDERNSWNSWNCNSLERSGSCWIVNKLKLMTEFLWTVAYYLSYQKTRKLGDRNPDSIYSNSIFFMC